MQANPPAEGFQAWVKANCPFTDRQAYRYLGEFDKLSNSPDAATDAPKRKSKGGRPKQDGIQKRCVAAGLFSSTAGQNTRDKVGKCKAWAEPPTC